MSSKSSESAVEDTERAGVATSSADSVASVDDFESDSSISDEYLNATPISRSDSLSSIPYLDLNKMLLFSDFDFGMGLDQVSDSARKKLKDMKKKTQEKLQKLKLDSRVRTSSSMGGSGSPKFSLNDVVDNAELARLQESIILRLSKFEKRIDANLQSSATEKLFYAIAVFLIAVCGFIIGKYPKWFHIFHTVLFCVLMPIRFYTYFKQSFQYYLADLCYYVNLLLILFIWVFPESTSLFISVFSLTMGTLSFAVITWRNSLVLHSIEKTTSSFIHIMPPVSMFVIVHEMPKDFVAQRFPAVANVESWHFINGILWTSFYYTIWQVCYHYFITIKRKEKIASGRVTSFSYLRKKNANKGIGKFVNSLPYNWMQIGAFTLIQFGYQIGTMLFCPIWFRYKHACGAFMCLIFVVASYNGATYYIDVFGKRLDKEVERLKREVIELRERQSKQDESAPVGEPKVEELSSK
ncbi:glycerophosphocholine acyltransferase 1 [[Candida] railenensis]|uniref:Glycerophosphocholine acyltransferase 1 n=1 Tax=[Candida] railenensis TaxID=45579 RepID=A0A9P0QKN8_9ASCO|nr:glycerophosphocholine acyltransferase 1 [[Candida] railenensis]